MKILCLTEPATHPAFDTTVELYNQMRRPDPRSLAEGVLVVWMTASNSHSDHDAIRRQAARGGARFCYYTRSGAKNLAGSLDDLLAEAGT